MGTALVFSGQGAQKPGMGLDLYENNGAARAVFEKAPTEIRRICFSGTPDELALTHNTQPCVYTVTMAAFAAFLTKKIPYDMAAGFSLGEYAALTASGVFDFETGIDLVTKRGAYMAECASEDSGMAAVLGERETVLRLIEQSEGGGMLLPVNYNAPTQIVVAGSGQRYQSFIKTAAENKLKVISLKVSGAFHSPMMQPASAKIRKLLGSLTLHAPRFPVYSNVTAKDMCGGDLIDLIARQTMSPVLWEQTVRNMIAAGADRFIEIGVGSTLCGLIRKIDRSVEVYNIDSCASLEKTAAAFLN
ncbi:MAG TPA: hypothetical protein DEQ02_09380 [Ruminococcaceae bacterium]|nr:hypothetical protein [Oscillospiraceae bacterium]